MTKKIFMLIFIVLFFFSPFSFAEVSNTTKVNYSDDANWLSLPSGEMLKKETDVFYVYPTVSSWETGNMDITVASERSLAKGIFEAQASVFKQSANIFSPYYRQMTTNVSLPEDPNAKATDLDAFKKGAADVLDAFDYYIEHLNQGRPFMIAGHSQGSMALIELLKMRFGENPELREKLIAAYIIGYTVTDEDLKKAELNCAQGELDTGVVVTFNTQSPTSAGGPMLLPGAHCINPLNWRTDTVYAASDENLGARFYNDQTGEFLREVPAYSDAQINSETGALMTRIPDGEELEIGPYSEGVYHRFDYAFWYRNLEENIKKRINAYFDGK